MYLSTAAFELNQSQGSTELLFELGGRMVMSSIVVYSVKHLYTVTSLAISLALLLYDCHSQS